MGTPKGKTTLLKTEDNTMKTKMNSKTAAKADAYRLQRTTTPENLELTIMHCGLLLVTGLPLGRSFFMPFGR